MEVGNEENHFPVRVIPDTCQHDLFTAAVHMYQDEEKFDLKWRTRGMRDEWAKLEQEVPGDLKTKIIFILESYVRSAHKYNWDFFGLKDTRLVDGLEKWLDIMSYVWDIWGKHTTILTTIRDPITYVHRIRKDKRFLPTQGEHLIQYLGVTEVWDYMLNIETVTFIPYPQAFEDGSVQDVIQSVGLPWKAEADIYDASRPTKVNQDMLDEFMDMFSHAEEAIEKYNHILNEIGRPDCRINL